MKATIKPLTQCPAWPIARRTGKRRIAINEHQFNAKNELPTKPTEDELPKKACALCVKEDRSPGHTALV